MRLVPRFSLRFVWIALTIFLIVFGIAVNYYQRYQVHEDISQKLQTLGYEVEETTSKFLGYPMKKTLVGLESPQSPSNPGYLAALRELPRPHELLRFANLNLIPNQEELELLLGAIEQFTNLEELYLDDVIFTEAQFARLSALSQLRVLSLTTCNIPPGGLELLARLPRLEKLLLVDAKFRPADLLAHPLPALRLLDLSGATITELPLTKSGWGRSPKLETLILGKLTLEKVTCEAGALPNLRHLDLAYQGGCPIDWPGISTAAPKLEALALHVAQLSDESAAALRQLTKLRYLHFNQESVNGFVEDHRITAFSQLPTVATATLDRMVGEVVVPVVKAALAKALVKDCPQWLYCRDYSDFQELVAPSSQGYGRPWASANWRPPSVAGPLTMPLPPRPVLPSYSADPLGETEALPSNPFDTPPELQPPMPNNTFDVPPVPPAADPLGPSSETNPLLLPDISIPKDASPRVPEK